MLCCSMNCIKYPECARAVCNAPAGTGDTVENLYSFGSAVYSIHNGEVMTETQYVCGPSTNYAEFIPTNIYKKGDTEMNDTLKVDVEISQYIEKEGLPDKVHVCSSFAEDDMVVIKCGETAIKLKGTELEKAIKCCTNNRW